MDQEPFATLAVLSWPRCFVNDPWLAPKRLIRVFYFRATLAFRTFRLFIIVTLSFFVLSGVVMIVVVVVTVWVIVIIMSVVVVTVKVVGVKAVNCIG